MELIKTPKIENVRMLDRFNSKEPSKGTLYLTTTHLIFVDPDGKKELWILHMHIANLQKLPITTSGSPIHLRCKNFLCVTFVIPKERDAMEIYECLLQLFQLTSLNDLYCFHYTASNEGVNRQAGWNSFDTQSEFYRQGVPNKHWVLTTINKDYEVCDTYPKHLFVPATANTHILYSSSKFRSRGRLPVLTYLHKNMASLTRCSQPLAGFSARCVEDEEYLKCILRTNPQSKFMYVVDTRPRINAMANRATGKGYENESFYENIKFQFLGIENIHVMRNSLQKLIDACELKVSSMSSFLSALESSGWLKHVLSILDTSVFIAKAIKEGTNVLVHCSDGWDRTAQTCSLACLLLDPYYRTINGFQALIEKEWLSFGHKFTERCGFIQGDPKEVSPVFTQFLDAVWQLTQQFPLAFQFNDRFLITIHDHVYSCQFGTFIGNCEKDRVDLRLSSRTFSLWGYMARHVSEFVNPLYKSDNFECADILEPCLAPQLIRLWRGLYNRFEHVHPREPLDDLLIATKDHISSLEDHNNLLEKRILQLRNSLAQKKKANGIVDEIAEGDSPSMDSLMPPIIEKGAVSPLKVSTLQELVDEIGSIALEWKSLRNIKECICTTPIDVSSKKFHCWSCGEVFCIRCIDRQIPLPGHLSRRPVPVCRHCYKTLMRSNSIDS